MEGVSTLTRYHSSVALGRVLAGLFQEHYADTAGTQVRREGEFL